MRKGSVYFFTITIAGIMMLLGSRGLLWAEAPAIRIDLKLDEPPSYYRDKPYYRYQDPIKASITVSNNSEKSLFVSKGFTSKSLYLEMRVVDPTGRLLIPKTVEERAEVPDAPPLPFVLHQDRLVRVAPCEILPPGPRPLQRVRDLKQFYSMSLPGFYSAQVQVSTMVFKGEVCDIHDYQWLGMLKSEIIYFYQEGKTKVEIAPPQWSLAWKTKKEIRQVEVLISPAEGVRMDDFKIETIRLNGVGAKGVEKVRTGLVAFFEPRECIESLGPVEAGKSYPVVISGRLRSGQPFGGGQRVQIVEVAGPPPPTRLKVE